MFRTKYLCLLSAFLFVHAYISLGATGTKMYPANEIPQLLKEEAHAVVRLNETHIRFTAPGEAMKTEKIAVTILDNEGTDYTLLQVAYSHFITIKTIEGNLYNKTGEKMKSLSKKDIEDQSLVTSGTLFDDFRFRSATLMWNEFPYTVEFTVEEEMTALIHTEEWMPIKHAFTSLEKASLTVETKPNLLFNYWSTEAIKPVITANIKGETYTWTLEALAPVKVEEFGPREDEQFPTVSITPLNYKIENNEAIIKDWSDMSRYFYEINKNRDVLSNAAANEIKELVKNCTDKRDSIKTIYNYFQNSTRYISVQIGLGGWQCFDANYVYKYKLGDCKALSNYMKALLKTVGIDACQALVFGDYTPPTIDRDHVSNAFNHVILFAPCEKDTVWLECTDQIEPFGYMSDFTQNRYCLPLCEKGSSLVRIPLSKEYVNGKKVFAELFIDSVGKLSGKVDVEYTGTYSDYANYYFTRKSDQKSKEWINENLRIRNGSIASAKLIESGRDIPKTRVTCTYKLDQSFSALSNRAFLKESIFDKMNKTPYLGEARKFNMINYFPVVIYDSIIYHLPKNLSVESYSQDEKKMESSLGIYHLQMKEDTENHLLTVVRTYSLNEFNLNKEKEAELKKYFAYVYRGDASEFILVKK